jgi:hypothetical protein
MHGVARLFLGVVALAPACSDGGLRPYASGLDGTRPLASLTPVESQRLCKTVQSWARDAIPAAQRSVFVCKSSGLVAAVLVASRGDPAGLEKACQRSYEECLEHAGMTPSALGCPVAGPACAATVGEYESCVNDFPASFDDAVAAVPPCDRLTLGAILTLGMTPLLPPSCAAFEARCPGTRVVGLPGLH